MDETFAEQKSEIEAQELQEKFEVLKSIAGSVVVKDEETLKIAEELMQRLKGELSEVHKILGTAKAELYEVYQKGIARYNEQFKPRDELKKELSKKCAAYRYQVEEKARIEIRRLEEIERKKQEELRIQEAQELEDQGRTEEAEAVIEQPISVAPIPVSKPPTTLGVSTRDNWKMRITNPDLIPREYCVTNETLMKQEAKMRKGKKKIAGVEFYNEPISVTR